MNNSTMGSTPSHQNVTVVINNADKIDDQSDGFDTFDNMGRTLEIVFVFVILAICIYIGWKMWKKFNEKVYANVQILHYKNTQQIPPISIVQKR